MSRSPSEVVHELLVGVPAMMSGPVDEVPTRAEALSLLYAEATDVRHPMSLTIDTPLLTRDDLRRHFTRGPELAPNIDHMESVDIRIHETADPEVVIGEFTYRITAAGQTSESPCIFVVRVRDGEVVESRDYSSSLHMARATGSLDRLLAALSTTDR